jgi:uncharacterized protein YceK
MLRSTWLVLLVISLSGCATIVTRQADLSKAPKGVRIYPPQVCLLVDAHANGGEGATIIVYLPDLDRAYDVRPLTVLAKQDFKVELDEGQLKTLTSNQDTTAFLAFMREAAQLAAKAAGLGVSASAPLKGAFGFAPGVHCLSDDGTFAP